MENISMLEKLTQRIDELLKNYNDLKLQNEELKTQLITCKAALEKRDEELRKLQDELAMRDLEIEEVIKKIESYME